jgi:hypothetical protein
MLQHQQVVYLSACGLPLAFEYSELTYLATGLKDVFAFHICPLDDNGLIERAERELIQTLSPAWNMALAR